MPRGAARSGGGGRGKWARLEGVLHARRVDRVFPMVGRIDVVGLMRWGRRRLPTSSAGMRAPSKYPQRLQRRIAAGPSEAQAFGPRRVPADGCCGIAATPRRGVGAEA